MYFPSEHRIRQIKQDIERMKKLKENPLKIAGELIDFVIKTKLEHLRKMYPNVVEEELFKLLRKNMMELKEKWKADLKDL